jgi:hypothetical protein
VTVTAAEHGIASAAMLVQVFDDSSPSQLIQPGLITVDTSTREVKVYFGVSQSGRVVICG